MTSPRQALAAIALPARRQRVPRLVSFGLLAALAASLLVYEPLSRFPNGLVYPGTIHLWIESGWAIAHLLLLVPAILSPVLAVWRQRLAAGIILAFSSTLVFLITYEVLEFILVNHDRDVMRFGEDFLRVPRIWRIILAVDAMLVCLTCIVLWRVHRQPLSQTLLPPSVVLLACVAGSVFGIEVWSRMLPARIVAAAEQVAGDRAYCMEAGSLPVLSLEQLQGRALIRTKGSTYTDMLILDEQQSSGRSWSFWRGAFVPLSPVISSCPSPRPHFALTLK